MACSAPGKTSNKGSLARESTGTAAAAAAIAKRARRGKKGRALPTSAIQLIAAAYKEAKAVLPEGAAVWLAKLALPPHSKATVAKGALKQLKGEEGSNRIADARKKPRKWGVAKTKTGAEKTKKAKQLRQQDKIALWNATRLTAGQLGP